jgi:hypothetical protein
MSTGADGSSDNASMQEQGSFFPQDGHLRRKKLHSGVEQNLKARR